MNTEAREIDDSKIVDKLASLCCNGSVIKASQVAKAIQKQTTADFDRLREIDSQQDKLRSEYLKFVDLEEERKRKTERLRRTSSLIADLLNDTFGKDQDEFGEYVIPVSDLTLWEAMLSVLEQTGEVQLAELLHVLEQLGKKVTRGAIESAITTHHDKFLAKTRGRERFVSLKR
jgi:hypothetical protein